MKLTLKCILERSCVALCPLVEWRSSSQWGAVIATTTNDGNENVKKSNRFNLVPRFSLLPVERPWLGLVTCLLEFGRFANKRFGGGADKCEICLHKA